MGANRVFETTGQDWANYLSHEVSGNGMIYLVALLSDKIDAETLRKATCDLIDLQPVLGCRFDECQNPPVWVPVCSEGCFKEIETNDLPQGLNEIIQNPPTQSGQIEVTLISAPGQTTVCLRFDHAATDAGGAKRCLALLSQCYSRRLCGQTTANRFSLDRSDGQVYKKCGLPDYRMALKREAPSAQPIATVPYTGCDGRTVRYSWTAMPLSVVKRTGSTVNDRLLAAFILALSKTCGDSRAAEIHMTVDLRRYLEETTAPMACNLSGMAQVRVELEPRASFERVLGDVARQTAALKSGHIGLSSAAMTTYLRALPYEKAKEALLEAGRKSRVSGMAAPILSNLGQIDPNMTFGENKVTGVISLLPALHSPAFMLGASGYGDTLTVSAGYYNEERSADEIGKLLFDIREILMTV